MRKRRFMKRAAASLLSACMLISTCSDTVWAEESSFVDDTVVVEDVEKTEETPAEEQTEAEQPSETNPSDSDKSETEQPEDTPQIDPSDPDAGNTENDDAGQGDAEEGEPSGDEQDGVMTDEEGDGVEEIEEIEEPTKTEDVRDVRADSDTEPLSAASDFTFTQDGSNATITGYTGEGTELVIPDTLDGCKVVAIGNDAFKANTSLVKVVVPNGVTEIGERAFYGCTELATVELPDGMTTIGDEAFKGCTNLSTVNLPKSLLKISHQAFMNCEALKEIEIPKSLQEVGYNAVFAGSGIEKVTFEEGTTKIADNALKSNTNLKTVVIPETVTEIGGRAFYGCTGLATVELPDGMTTIGDEAFKGCANLSTVNLPKSLLKISHQAFMNCEALKEIEIPKSLQEVGYNAVFAGSGIEKVTFEEGTTKIADNALRSNTNLKTVVIPETVTEIGGRAFYDCTGLAAVELPDSITSIGDEAFKGCTNLSTVNLPKSLLKISHQAFVNCAALKEIEIPKSLKEVGYNEVFEGSGIETVTFEAGTTKIVDYLFAKCGQLQSVTIPATVTTIGARSFEGCTSLSEIEIPGSVTSIGNYAFSGCTSLTGAVIPDSVTTIGDCAFSGCSSLAQLVLSKRVTDIGKQAFRNCTSLAEVEIPKSLAKVDSIFDGCSSLKKIAFEEGTEKIRDNLLSGCTGIEEIVIPETVTEIGRGAFRGCSSLTKIDIPNSVISIGDNALSGCSSLPVVEIPDSVETIGKSVFSNCTALTSAEIAESVTTLGNSVFSGCTSLTFVKLPDSVTDLGNAAFEGCTKLSSVTLSQNLKAIGSSAFRNSGVTTMTVPASVTEIGDRAFENCTALAEVNLSEGLASIGSNAFYNCETLQGITIPDSVRSLGAYIFAECDSLADVTLGTGITTIPAYAFNLCPALTKIILPYRVVSVEDNAFTNCVALVDITIPRATTSIGENAFSYAYLDKLTVHGVRGTYAETFANERKVTFEPIEIPATEVKLNKTELSLYKHDTAELFLSVKPVEFTDEVVWRSLDESVAAVTDEGIVTAVGVGRTQIKVTVGSTEVFCDVTVVQPVTAIWLDKSSLELEAWETDTLTVVVSPEDALNKDVTWSSSDDAVASVDQDGVVTAKTKGTATIRATAQDGSGVYDTCSVTVTNSGYLCAGAEEMESPHDYLPNCTDFWVYTKEGAEKLTLTFDEKTKVEEGYDFICIYDGKNKQTGRYTGTQLAGRTIEVDGDTVKIRLVTDDKGNMWGFKVISISDPESVLEEDIPEDGKIPEGMWIAGVDQSGYAYTGNAIKPDIRVYDGNRRLRAGTDYTVTYKNNKKANDASVAKTAPTITVKGKGNYSETVPVTFRINQVNLEDSSVAMADIMLAPTGKVQKKVPTVTMDGKKLNKGRDFEVSYPDTSEGAYKNPGEYEVRLDGKGNFAGTKSVKIVITEKTLIANAKTAKIVNKVYNNEQYAEDYRVTLSETELVVYMKSKNDPLKRDVDYTVAYENNDKVGTATAIITGIGNCVGTKRVNFKITGISLAKAKVNGITTPKVYNGEEQMQEIEVQLNHVTLTRDKDYTVAYDKNLNAGTASVTITGIGSYTGTIRKNFKITAYPLMNSMIVESQSALTVKYVKGGCKPKVTLLMKDASGRLIQELTEGTDYQLSYSNNTNIADAAAKKAPTITIKGKGNFKGTLTRKFTIETKALNDKNAPVSMTIADVGYASGAGKYISKPTLTDVDGKVLKANTDYAVEYKLEDGTLLNKNSTVEMGTEIYVTAIGKGKYAETGSLQGKYRVTQYAFQKASIKIDPQIYTGRKIELTKDAVHVKVGGNNAELEFGTDFEIVENSYVNNIKIGTASVQIRGKGNYGGTKTVKFKIQKKKISFQEITK